MAHVTHVGTAVAPALIAEAPNEALWLVGALRHPGTVLETERLTLREAAFVPGVDFLISLKGEEFILGSVQLRFEPGATEACKGTWIHHQYRGRGLAAEANLAVLRHAFERLKLKRVFTNPEAKNTASIRVQQKLGMRYQGRIGNADIYAITSTDFWTQRGAQHA